MAFDAFLKIGSGPDVKGESTDDKHKNEIEIASFSFGASNPSTIGSGTGGTGGGKVSISSLNVMKKTDKSSAMLFQACCAGDHYATATLTLRKAGGKSPLEYLIYTFTEFYVDSVQWSGSAGGGDSTPSESVSFSFASVHVKYVPQKADGTGDSPIEGGWDVTTNKAK
jgi:type VI secretion system secreted protein Hcp